LRQGERVRRERALQLIGESAWDAAALLADRRRFVADTPGEDDGVLIIDDSDVRQQTRPALARPASSRSSARSASRVQQPPPQPDPTRFDLI
jgi:hypothetical protein